MRIAAATRTHGGFDRSGEAAIGINVLAAHHQIAAASATRHGSGKVDLNSVFYRS
jgi:hypothetical protein